MNDNELEDEVRALVRGWAKGDGNAIVSLLAMENQAKVWDIALQCALEMHE